MFTAMRELLDFGERMLIGAGMRLTGDMLFTVGRVMRLVAGELGMAVCGSSGSCDGVG